MSEHLSVWDSYVDLMAKAGLVKSPNVDAFMSIRDKKFIHTASPESIAELKQVESELASMHMQDEAAALHAIIAKLQKIVAK